MAAGGDVVLCVAEGPFITSIGIEMAGKLEQKHIDSYVTSGHGIGS